MVRPRFVVQAIGWAVVGLTALIVLDRSRHVLALALLALVIAALLRAPIEHLDRAAPRWAAITVVVIGSIAVATGLLTLGTVQLRHEIDVVGTAIEERIDGVDPESSLGADPDRERRPCRWGARGARSAAGGGPRAVRTRKRWSAGAGGPGRRPSRLVGGARA